MHRKFVTALMVTTACIGGMVFGTTAHAQTNDASVSGSQNAGDPTPATTSQQPEEVADIIVTGSSIRGAPPIGSSLIQVGREQIEASTASTTDQLVKEIPQILNLGVTDGTRSGAAGSLNVAYGNSINIRGIGPYATLTLINSRRTVAQGTSGAVVDPINIPALALERIEIIADGASAIYGSDAVSGVANLILRRKYDGVGADVQYGTGDDYHSFTANMIFGTSWSTGNIVVAAQHAYRSALSGLDRSFYASDLTASGGHDYRTTLCNPGNIVIGGTSYAIPASGATPANLIGNTVNRCDVLKLADLLPQQEINGGVITINQELADGLHLSLDGLYSRRDGLYRAAVGTATLTVPSSNAFFVAPANAILPLCAASVGAPAGSRCENVQYDFAKDYGPFAPQRFRSEVAQITGSLDYSISNNWNANAYLTYAENRDVLDRVGDSLNPTNLAVALASGNPATAFNPFGTSVNSRSVINALFDRFTQIRGKQKFWDAGVKVDGSLFTLPGGDVKVAVGGEYNTLNIVTGLLRGPLGAQVGGLQDLSRHVLSGYAELLVPIFGEDNKVSGIQSLTLDAALRIDRYSDVGSTVNPKFGVNWESTDGLTLHGSYGTSFRAPLLTQIYGATATPLLNVFPTFDPTANGGAGATVQSAQIVGANLDLKPETARTWSLGVEYAPDWIPGARLSLNYFNVRYANQIVQAPTDVLRQEAAYRSVIFRGTAATARIQELLASGVPVGTGTLAEIVAAPVFLDGRPANLGLTKAQGIDFEISAPFSLANVGDFRVGLNGTRFFKFDSAATPTAPIVARVNSYTYPVKFRARGALNYRRGIFDANLFVNYVNGYENRLVAPVQSIKSYTTIDTSITVNLAKLIPVADNLRLGLEVTNLFDRKPPFVDIGSAGGAAGGYDPSNANPVGRVVMFALRTKF